MLCKSSATTTSSRKVCTCTCKLEHFFVCFLIVGVGGGGLFMYRMFIRGVISGLFMSRGFSSCLGIIHL